MATNLSASFLNITSPTALAVLTSPGPVLRAFNQADSRLWFNLSGTDARTSQILRRQGAKGWSLINGRSLPTSPDPSLGDTLVTTPLAKPLLQFVNASRADISGTAASLLTPINFNADLFADRPALLSGNYGFEGYIGIPGMNGTDASSQQIAAAYNVAWNSVDASLNASQRALTSAASTDNAARVYGVDLLQADTMPLVFSYPLLPTQLNATDFLVTLSDGSRVTPQVAAFLPNLEFNERQTVVIAGEFGNRLQPGQPGALYPVSVTVVNDGSPLELLTAEGPVSAVGLSVASANPYVEGNGPTLLAAKLNRLNNLGEGGPIGVSLASQNNSGLDLYGTAAQYRLRLYTSAGFSPDGISSLLPSEFSRYFLLEATSADGSIITIDATDAPVQIGEFGSITVLGLADLAPAGTPENAAYVEDHDNYYDIILAGDAAAIARLSRVRMPSFGAYQAVYNPGGPGNDPGAEGAAPGPFTGASGDQSIPITQDLDNRLLATFVEVDGPVLRNPFDARPIGRLLGVAIEDTVTGQGIDAYEDSQGRRFYASFAAAPARATDLPSGLADTRPIDLLDTRGWAAESMLTVSGSVSRSAAYASTLQFYAVLDASGTVRDPVSGQLLQPSDPGYRQVALNAANLLSTTGSSLSAANGTVTPFSFSVSGGQLFAPVLTVQNTGLQVFSFAAANPGGVSQFNGFGPNAYGIEDRAGGGDRDYDDLILRFVINS